MIVVLWFSELIILLLAISRLNVDIHLQKLYFFIV